MEQLLSTMEQIIYNEDQIELFARKTDTSLPRKEKPYKGLVLQGADCV